MIVKSNAYSFKLFGFNFLIWKRKPNPNHNQSGGIVNGSCKLIRHQDYIALAMPDGTLIPHQIDLSVESNLHEAATATVKMFVSID